MSLISGIIRYINSGDITLDPTRLPKQDFCSRLVRTVEIGIASSLGITFSPVSVVLGTGTGLYYGAISLESNINLYLNNNKTSTCNLALRIICSILIEIPCIVIASSSALFFDILTCFLQQIIYDNVEMNNYNAIVGLLDNMTTFFNKALNKT